jgi:hypothetical protein
VRRKLVLAAVCLVLASWATLANLPLVYPPPAPEETKVVAVREKPVRPSVPAVPAPAKAPPRPRPAPAPSPAGGPSLEGTPAWGGPGLAVLAAYKDLLGVPKPVRRYMRYLWVPAQTVAEMEDWGVVLTYHVNLLSRAGKVGRPVWITPGLLRFDLSDYAPHPYLGTFFDKAWEKTANNDTFAHVRVQTVVETETYYGGRKYPVKVKVPGKKKVGSSPWLPTAEASFLTYWTQSKSPVLMGQWFFVQSARQISIRNQQEGTGYYDFLGLKNRNDFLKLVGLDEQAAVDRFAELRAAIQKSGASQQPRQVVRFGSQVGGGGASTGPVWVTLDVFNATDRGNPVRNLRRGDLIHDAEEWYGFLPNGLPVTFLSDNNGVRQDNAPDKLGGNTSPYNVGRDTRIHVNLACLQCHGKHDNLMPLKDFARDRFQATKNTFLRSPDKRLYLELESQYLRDIQAPLEGDRVFYTRGVWNVTNRTIPKVTELYARAWNNYVEGAVTLKRAGLYLGCSPNHLQDMLRKFSADPPAGFGAQLDPIFAAYLGDPPSGMVITEFEELYPVMQGLIRGMTQ